MAEENQEGVPRRLKRFYRQGSEGGAEQGDVFSKPLPYQGGKQEMEKKKSEAPAEREQEEQAETIYREQESEEKEIGWDKKRREELEEMKGELTTQKVREFRERHHRLPEGSEEEEIARSVFGQLQKEEEKMKDEEKQKRLEDRKPQEGGAEKAGKEGKKTGGFRGRQKAVPQKPAIAEGAEHDEAGMKGSEMLELMKENTQEKAKQKAKAEEPGNEELGELEEVDGEGEEEEEAAKAKSCPNCKKETEATVFCPECGAEFCDSCAVPKRLAGKLKYKCPKCGYEFSKSG